MRQGLLLSGRRARCRGRRDPGRVGQRPAGRGTSRSGIAACQAGTPGWHELSADGFGRARRGGPIADQQGTAAIWGPSQGSERRTPGRKMVPAEIAALAGRPCTTKVDGGIESGMDSEIALETSWPCSSRRADPTASGNTTSCGAPQSGTFPTRPVLRGPVRTGEIRSGSRSYAAGSIGRNGQTCCAFDPALLLGTGLIRPDAAAHGAACFLCCWSSPLCSLASQRIQELAVPVHRSKLWKPEPDQLADIAMLTVTDDRPTIETTSTTSSNRPRLRIDMQSAAAARASPGGTMRSQRRACARRHRSGSCDDCETQTRRTPQTAEGHEPAQLLAATEHRRSSRSRSHRQRRQESTRFGSKNPALRTPAGRGRGERHPRHQLIEALQLAIGRGP